MKRFVAGAGLSLLFLLAGCRAQPASDAQPQTQRPPQRRSPEDIPRPVHPLPNAPGNPLPVLPSITLPGANPGQPAAPAAASTVGGDR